jgi:hypothetical protein
MKKILKGVEMKKALTLTLALLLTACGVIQPAVQQEQPTPIVQTVVVVATAQATQPAPPTAISLPTQGPTNTAVPADTATTAPTETLVPTSAPAATEVVPTLSSSSTTDLKPVNVSNDLGKGVFKDITFSSDLLTLQCFPREMTITITANLPEIVDAIMYYRMVDNPAALYPSEWKNLGEMVSDKQGHFSFVLEALDLNPDLRILEKAWIDFQFIGINKGGGVVDRTQKIERLVTYRKACP